MKALMALVFLGGAELAEQGFCDCPVEGGFVIEAAGPEAMEPFQGRVPSDTECEMNAAMPKVDSLDLRQVVEKGTGAEGSVAGRIPVELPAGDRAAERTRPGRKRVQGEFETGSEAGEWGSHGSWCLVKQDGFPMAPKAIGFPTEF